ncbi:TraM recognition domain-containing protein, partial [Patescibacteria group bacterium]|nr:TraM recognition domain-containing protein [Patescibacteria group bacterium]
DNKKIFIMNLSKGKIGEENSRLIGAMLITKIYLAAMSRVDTPEAERNDFYLYVDEFQNFATESFKDILSEARKYRLDLILAHQYIAQMDEKVRDAVFGNVGTLMAFRVGAYDAEILEKEFAPEFNIQDIVNLGFASIYLKLMIDGVASRPFSASTLPPISHSGESFAEKIIERSRDKYATPRTEVEEKISEWHAELKHEKEKSSGPAISRSLPHVGSGQQNQPQLFEAYCSVCNKKTYVPFKPDSSRPVFCKNHRIPHIKAHKDETISLSELEGKAKREPKIDELRELLEEIKSSQNAENKKGVLKPGEKVNLE